MPAEDEEIRDLRESSRELLHEVLPSHSRRLAISLWLLDGALPLRDG